MDTAAEILQHEFISCDPPMETAKAWTRSGDKRKIEQAVELLKALHERFPEVRDIDEELALALLEYGRPDEAESVLVNAEVYDRNPSEERLCRWGRLFKDEGDKYVSWMEGQPDKEAHIAVRRYRLALKKYREAYDIRRGHFPGVNLASLYLVIYAVSPEHAKDPGDREKSKEVARTLLEQRGSWPHEHTDDDIWHLATAAECHLLLEQFDKAVEQYRLAWEQKGCRPFHQESARRNAERNIHCLRRIGMTDLGPFVDLDPIFQPEESEEQAGEAASV